jgi:NAD(P)-dependent dehydrogenase (short-subunit alcohol dehydrogenase family)
MTNAEKPFQNDLVVVTGAGSGIGRATALGFAANGARVIAADLDLSTATSVCELIRRRGGDAHARQVDVASAPDMERFAAWTHAEIGVPDVVVNNAGIVINGPFLGHSEEDWRQIIGVNLFGVIRGCRLFGAQMVDRGEGGHIVNVASAAAFWPAPYQPAYSATKAAVLTLSEYLRAELACYNIGVTAICPGLTSTPIAHAVRFVGMSAAETQRQRQLGISALRRRRFPPEKVAVAVMRAVLRDRAVVPVNAESKIVYVLSRLAPGAMRGLSALVARRAGQPAGK